MKKARAIETLSKAKVLEWIYAQMIDAELMSEQEMLEQFEAKVKSGELDEVVK